METFSGICVFSCMIISLKCERGINFVLFLVFVFQLVAQFSFYYQIWSLLTELHVLQGVEGIKAYGIENLIRIAASQLSDQLPESREAARSLLLELQNIYEKAFNVIPPPVVNEDPETITVSEDPETISWEHFCQSKLSPLSAQAVLRVTNLTREGIVLGSQYLFKQ